jgi:cytochrome c peroxidase
MQRMRGRAARTSVLALVVGFVMTAEAARASAQDPARDLRVFFQILMGATPEAIEDDISLPDPTGRIGTYQPAGATFTDANAFFASDLTRNGRSCFTCHQPQNGWEISPPQIRAQFLTTLGRSSLFAPIDAADCPNLPGATAPPYRKSFVRARSQLFERGNFRIGLNAPNPLGPADETYRTVGGNTHPEWVLTVKHDPYGCELDPEHGLPANLLSVYRRPLPSANVAFLHQGGDPSKFDIMWDAREPDLRAQFINATLFHGETTVAPDDESITQGVQFQAGAFTGQSHDARAGDLTGGGALGGPVSLYASRQASSSPCSSTGASGELVCAGIKVKHTLPNGLRMNVGFDLYAAFATPTASDPLRRARQESIARGEALFSSRVFTINFVAGLNDVKGDPNGTEPGTCSTCHSNMNVGNDTAGDPKRLGIMDNSSGVPVMPPTPDFPRFAFYCPTGSIPFFANPVTSPDCPGSVPGSDATCDEFLTTDPGKGLITGLCKDLGKMKVPVLRGLASRAPYFHGGNAATLTDVVNFYDTRFAIGLTPQEKQDLVNFLNAL